MLAAVNDVYFLAVADFFEGSFVYSCLFLLLFSTVFPSVYVQLVYATQFGVMYGRAKSVAFRAAHDGTWHSWCGCSSGREVSTTYFLKCPVVFVVSCFQRHEPRFDRPSNRT